MNQLQKDDALEYIILYTQKAGLTPNDNTFAGITIKICISKFAMQRAEAKKILDLLNTAWRTDHWRRFKETLIRNPDPQPTATTPNPTPTATATPRKFEEALNEIQRTITKITQSKHQPINLPTTQKPTQQDHINNKQFIQTLYSTAKKDTDPSNVGRITLSDARDIADNQHLNCNDIRNLWRIHYPLHDIEQRQGNILLIYWDGKENLKREKPTVKQPPPQIDNYAVYHVFKADKKKKEDYNPDTFKATPENYMIGEVAEPDDGEIYEETEEVVEDDY